MKETDYRAGICSMLRTGVHADGTPVKKTSTKKKSTKKKDTVWVGVWHLEADDDVVFVSRTLRGLDLQVYEAIKEGFAEVFEDNPVPKSKSKAIGEYFQLCSDRGIAEWLLTTKEEIKP